MQDTGTRWTLTQDGDAREVDFRAFCTANKISAQEESLLLALPVGESWVVPAGEGLSLLTRAA